MAGGCCVCIFWCWCCAVENKIYKKHPPLKYSSGLWSISNQNHPDIRQLGLNLLNHLTHAQHVWKFLFSFYSVKLHKMVVEPDINSPQTSNIVAWELYNYYYSVHTIWYHVQLLLLLLCGYCCQNVQVGTTSLISVVITM